LPCVAPAAEFYPTIARDAAGGSQNIAQLLFAAPSSTTAAAAAGSGSFIGWLQQQQQQQQLEGTGSQLQPGTPVQSQSPAVAAAGGFGGGPQQQQQMYPGLGSIPSQIMLMPGMPVQQSAQIPAGWLQPLQPEQQHDSQQVLLNMSLQHQQAQQRPGLLQQRRSGGAQPQDQQPQQRQQQQQQPQQPQQPQIPKLLGGLSLDDQICMHLQQQHKQQPAQQQQHLDQASDPDVAPQQQHPDQQQRSPDQLQQHPDQQQRSSPDQPQQQQQLPRPPHPLNARSFLRRNTTLWAREIMDSRCNVDMAMLEFDPGEEACEV
jgi:hypothetical protein